MALPAGWTQVPGTQPIESGQAWVYQVTKSGIDDEARFALKRLKNPKRAARFNREVETMAALSSAGVAVPPVIDVGVAEKDNRPYVVTPWFRDGSLESKVRSREYVADPVAGLHILEDLAYILRDIHNSGVAHRDLKPSNVLLDGQKLAITDFGLALPVDDQSERWTATAEGIGSRFYIAPENESGMNTEVDQRPADFYAFGKMLYALMAGKQPGAGMAQMNDRLRLEVVSQHEELATLAALQRDLLNADPRARLQDWETVARELRSSLQAFGVGKHEQTAATSDVIKQALEAARRYTASREVMAADNERRKKEESEQIAKQLDASLSRGFRTWDDQIDALDKEIGGTANIRLSSGGNDLRSMLQRDDFRAFLQKHGVPYGQTKALHNDSYGSPALFTLHVELPSFNEAIWVTTYSLLIDMSVWLIRFPLYIAYDSSRGVVIPPGLLDKFGEAVGPMRAGLSSTDRRAEEFGQDCGRVGMELALQFLSNPSGGLAGLVSRLQ